MDDKLKNTKELLKAYNQEQLLHFYQTLNKQEKEALLNDIQDINFELIANTYNKRNGMQESQKQKEYKPLIAQKLKLYSDKEKLNFYKIGIKAIAEGKIAVYLVAGGQGTRLGQMGPKGTYNIGLPSGKSLFQLQCERLIYLSELAQKDIPFYIMTNIENHQVTVDFFEKNKYFGYKKSMIMFFKQKSLPAVDEDGKILLSEINKVNMSPNGNGGCFLALRESGALNDMKEKGVEWLFLYGIDNALVRVADPYFIGFTIFSKQLAASKVVAKRYPEEKVGILCYKNNKPSIVEYSELPKYMSEATNEQRERLYSNANILNHVLNIKFIDSLTDLSMPLHIAHKKIEYIDEAEMKVIPTKPNGYKFEYFLFDIFEQLNGMAALEVEREEEFAPVKNTEGEDSPKTAKDLILNLHKRWLINAGVDRYLLENKEIEISPLISYYGDNLSNDNIRTILKASITSYSS